jgi:hypothetical protein
MLQFSIQRPPITSVGLQFDFSQVPDYCPADSNMKSQPANPKGPQTSIEQRLRAMLVLWLGMLGSIGGYYVLTLFTGPSEDTTPNPTVSLTLIAIGLLMTLISFPIKNKLLTTAVDRQEVQLVQQGYIVAWAVCEVAALLGLLDFFLTGHRHYYLLFIIAAAGQLLHFPRREHIINASFKSPLL